LLHDDEDDEAAELLPLELECLRDTARFMIEEGLAVVADDSRPGDSLLGSALPPRVFIADPERRLLEAVVALIALADRIYDTRPELAPRCLLEELVAFALLETTEASLVDEHGHDPSPAWDSFRMMTFEDEDFLYLWDDSLDGIDQSPIGQLVGMTSLSIRDWGFPFRDDRPVHPFYASDDDIGADTA